MAGPRGTALILVLIWGLFKVFCSSSNLYRSASGNKIFYHVLTAQIWLPSTAATAKNDGSICDASTTRPTQDLMCPRSSCCLEYGITTIRIYHLMILVRTLPETQKLRCSLAFFRNKFQARSRAVSITNTALPLSTFGN